MTERVDGREAYRDDPEYTAPEMQPGNGEDLKPEPNAVPVQVRFANPDEDHLLQQLNTLNQFMTRTARR